MGPKNLEKNARNRGKQHYPRSFVRRGRTTLSQKEAIKTGWPLFGLSTRDGKLHVEKIFGRQASLFLEIGFGSGDTLFQLATLHPDHNFIGVETHTPGLGQLLKKMMQAGLTNIRLYEADVRDVLEHTIPDHLLSGIQFFFPDPWPKRRHFDRRLIQSDFVRQMVKKLKRGGELHLATDWEDYAIQMISILSAEKSLFNLAGPYQFSQRSPLRLCETKFERRAIQAGRAVRELQFVKI